MAQVPVVVVQPAEQSAQRIEARGHERQTDRPAEPAVDDEVLEELRQGRSAYESRSAELSRQ